MSPLMLLIVGVVLLIVAHYLPAAPPTVRGVLQALGWACVAVGIILFVVALLGMAL